MSMDYDLLKRGLDGVRSHLGGVKPTFGMVLGSGWSKVAAAFEPEREIEYGDIPGFGDVGVVGHAGRLGVSHFAGVETLLFQGRRHWFEGDGWTPIALPIYIMRELGVKAVVLTNAAGGIREDLVPGDIMLISDYINMMGVDPLVGPHNEIWGERFPDYTEAYNLELRQEVRIAAESIGFQIKEGVYSARSGPTYESPAEIRMLERIGVDAIGMSTVPETILAHGAGMKVCGFSCITNLAAGRSGEKLSHQEVMDTTDRAMASMKKLFLATWERFSTLDIG